jgi:hypothetical protein
MHHCMLNHSSLPFVFVPDILVYVLQIFFCAMNYDCILLCCVQSVSTCGRFKGKIMKFGSKNVCCVCAGT